MLRHALAVLDELKRSDLVPDQLNFGFLNPLVDAWVAFVPQKDLVSFKVDFGLLHFLLIVGL